MIFFNFKQIQQVNDNYFENDINNDTDYNTEDNSLIR